MHRLNLERTSCVQLGIIAPRPSPGGHRRAAGRFGSNDQNDAGANNCTQTDTVVKSESCNRPLCRVLGQIMHRDREWDLKTRYVRIYVHYGTKKGR